MIGVKSIKISIALSVLFLISACGGKPQVGDLSKPLLPQQYPHAFTDSLKSVAQTPWQLVFKDSSLTQLIKAALKKNFSLQLAYQHINLAQAQLKQARMFWLPELGLSANSGVRKFGDYTMDGVGNYDTKFSPNINQKQQIPNPLPDYYFGFQSSWEIDVWRKLTHRKRATVFRFQATRAAQNYLTTQVISQVAQSYYEWIALHHQQDILQDNMELQQAAYDMVVAQKAAGRANELAVELLKAQLLSSKTLSVEVREKKQQCEAAIAYLCGTFPKQIRLDTVLKSVVSPQKLNAGLPADLLRYRADIVQAELDLHACNADVKAARAAFYPSINLSANMGLQSFNAALLLETPASLAYNLAGGLAQPIFARKRLKSELMQAKVQQRKAYIGYEQTVVAAFTEVYNALNTIDNVAEMTALKRQEAQTLRQSISIANELFLAGRATYLEVVTAQKNALQAQIDLIEYEKRNYIAEVNLYRALGGGWN